MTEQLPSSIGTVAQEAARLIEDMATMARSSHRRDDGPGPYAGERAQAPDWPEASRSAGPVEPDEAEGSEAADEPADGTCSICGAEHHGTPGDETPSTCRICPLCRAIALLRSVRPETVDLLADFAMSVAGSLRDVAVWSRTSDPASSARSTSAGAPAPARAPVQHIPVDDESEG
jgi:hypothetical protein